ncbi:14540_t:CDS:2, partial [Ambispora leptoticha]
IAGHEIIGKVVAKGSEVIKFNIGDRVGIGCQVSSCQKCEECTNGYDQLCPIKTFAYNDVWKDVNGNVTGYRAHGGYADRIRAQAEFTFHIPKEISSAEAAPLLCAGVTTFTPLKHHKIGPGKKVAVSGIGGLGHLGIQWASKLGAEVTAISH